MPDGPSAPSRGRIVVTGAASGIGRAVAVRLLADGEDVLAVDIAADRLEDLEAAGAATVAADLGTEEGCAAVVAAAGDGIGGLVNSAAIILLKPIMQISRDEWRQVQRVNAESVFFLCQALGPRIAAGGAIVNLASSAAKLANTVEAAAYAASKTTILSITRSFAYALAPSGVRVNALCPGMIDTPMQDRVLDEVAKSRGIERDALSAGRTAMIPLGRAGAPEECAGLVRFLLSSEASYMTGQAINITGGQVTW